MLEKNLSHHQQICNSECCETDSIDIEEEDDDLLL